MGVPLYVSYGHKVEECGLDYVAPDRTGGGPCEYRNEPMIS